MCCETPEGGGQPPSGPEGGGIAPTQKPAPEVPSKQSTFTVATTVREPIPGPDVEVPTPAPIEKPEGTPAPATAPVLTAVEGDDPSGQDTPEPTGTGTPKPTEIQTPSPTPTGDVETGGKKTFTIATALGVEHGGDGPTSPPETSEPGPTPGDEKPDPTQAGTPQPEPSDGSGRTFTIATALSDSDHAGPGDTPAPTKPHGEEPSGQPTPHPSGGDVPTLNPTPSEEVPSSPPAITVVEAQPSLKPSDGGPIQPSDATSEPSGPGDKPEGPAGAPEDVCNAFTVSTALKEGVTDLPTPPPPLYPSDL